MEIFNTILGWLDNIFGAVLFMLPNSPIRPFIAELGSMEWLGYINYFVPIGKIIAVSLAWVGAIGVFYAVQVILRWVKVIGD